MHSTKKLLALGVTVLALAEPAFAQTAEGGMSLGQLGAGVGIGIAVLGGALGQGRLMSSLVESVSRNPGAAGQMNTPMFVGLAFIESLVIFALLISGRLAGLF